MFSLPCMVQVYEWTHSRSKVCGIKKDEVSIKSSNFTVWFWGFFHPPLYTFYSTILFTQAFFKCGNFLEHPTVAPLSLSQNIDFLFLRFLFLFLCWRLIIVTLLQWYNFRTARSVTLWCIRQGGKSSNCISSPHWGSPEASSWVGWLADADALSFCHLGNDLLHFGVRWCPGLLYGVHLWCL